MPALVAQTTQANMYAAAITTFVLAVVAVALRFLVRKLKGVNWWLDDWLVLAALVISIGFVTDFFIWISKGAGLHWTEIDEEYPLIVYNLLLCYFIGDLLYSVALALAQLSILAFYWRIFNATSIRTPIKVLTVVVLVWVCVRIIAIVLHCVPVAGFWDKTIEAHCGVNDQQFVMGSLLAHLILDVILIVLPIRYIYSLQISLARKLSIVGILFLGGFVCIATIIQLYVTWNLDIMDPDISYNFAPIGLWATVEINLSIIAACLPSLRPYLAMIFHGSISIERVTGGTNSTSSNSTKSLKRTKRTEPTVQQRGASRWFNMGDWGSPDNSQAFTTLAEEERGETGGTSMGMGVWEGPGRSEHKVGTAPIPLEQVEKVQQMGTGRIMVKKDVDVDRYRKGEQNMSSTPEMGRG